ncbi:MAG: putative transcriptional regulator [Phormidesmis priestleyi Ana]|uniref:Putative transcriptional regulator n=1 Tax=Phormidesmis priestleyi Ana TaxID=1666911 RepID=A0A0P7ZNW6_9CYAN|nr:MAG: putative transcriptional regulator [Phormidesmis priestleyi Ana]
MVEVLRKKAKVTQEALSDALGITDHTYRNWIKGRSEPTMTVRQMKRLCELLECSLDDLPDDFTEVDLQDN